MNGFINTLSDAVLTKKFDGCTVEELQQLADKYPYSASLQFLYAQKLMLSDSKDFSAQQQKTLLYYNNPLFINHILRTYNVHQKTISTTEILTGAAPSSPETSIIIPQQSTVESEISKEEAAIVTNIPVTANIGKFVLNTEQEDDVTEENDPESEENLPPLPEFKIEAIDPATAQFAFTPYYTVDYFAAQGIKLTDEPKAENDRFGTQLKNFTSWLKQMKRLPGATVKSNITISEEKTIEQMATQSISGENADTEAMAEVWIKQGDLKKAISIYKKLSLQIPVKSAYFAAKIDYLKK